MAGLTALSEAASSVAAAVSTQTLPAKSADALSRVVCQCPAGDFRLTLLAPGLLVVTANLLQPSELLPLGLVCYPPPICVDLPRPPLQLTVLGRRVQLKFWSPREVHQWLAAPARAQLPAQQGGSASHGGAAGPAVCCHLVLQGCSRCSPASILPTLAAAVAVQVTEYAAALVAAADAALADLRQPQSVGASTTGSSAATSAGNRAGGGGAGGGRGAESSTGVSLSAGSLSINQAAAGSGTAAAWSGTPAAGSGTAALRKEPAASRSPGGSSGSQHPWAAVDATRRGSGEDGSLLFEDDNFAGRPALRLSLQLSSVGGSGERSPQPSPHHSGSPLLPERRPSAERPLHYNAAAGGADGFDHHRRQSGSSWQPTHTSVAFADMLAAGADAKSGGNDVGGRGGDRRGLQAFLAAQLALLESQQVGQRVGGTEHWSSCPDSAKSGGSSEAAQPAAARRSVKAPEPAFLQGESPLAAAAKALPAAAKEAKDAAAELLRGAAAAGTAAGSEILEAVPSISAAVPAIREALPVSEETLKACAAVGAAAGAAAGVAAVLNAAAPAASAAVLVATGDAAAATNAAAAMGAAAAPAAAAVAEAVCAGTGDAAAAAAAVGAAAAPAACAAAEAAGTGACDAAGAAVDAAATLSAAAVPAAAEAVATVVPAAAEAVLEAVPAVAEAVSTAVPAAAEAVATAVPAAAEAVSTAVPKAAEAVSTVVPATAEAVSTAVPAAAEAVSTAVPAAAKVVSNAAGDAVAVAIDAAVDAGAAARNAVLPLPLVGASGLLGAAAGLVCAETAMQPTSDSHQRAPSSVPGASSSFESACTCRSLPEITAAEGPDSTCGGEIDGGGSVGGGGSGCSSGDSGGSRSISDASGVAPRKPMQLRGGGGGGGGAAEGGNVEAGALAGAAGPDSGDGPRDDGGDPGEDDDASCGELRPSPPAGASGSGAACGATPCPPWLMFRDGAVERRFCRWQAERQLRVDVLCSVLLLLACVGAALAPPAIRAPFALLPLPLPKAMAALAAVPPICMWLSLAWYLDHREALLQIVAAGLVTAHCYGGAPLARDLHAVRSNSWPDATPVVLSVLQAALTLGFRVRLHVCVAGQAALACGAWGAAAAGAGAQHLALLGRVADGLAGTVAFGFLLPLSVAFRLEQRDRHRFGQLARGS